VQASKGVAASRVSALFASYFCFVGVLSPFLSLYFESNGFSVTDIAFLMALPSAVRMLGPLAWGSLADRTGKPVLLLRIGAIGMAVSVLLFLVTSQIGWFALIVFVLFWFSSVMGPVSESLAMKASVGMAGKYGRMRVWGSVGFMAGVMCIGPLLDFTGVKTLPLFMFAAACVLAVVCWKMPELSADQVVLPINSSPQMVQGLAPAPAVTETAQSVTRLLQRPDIALFFLSALLMVFAHGAIYTFYSLQLQRVGFSKTAISAFWALGVLAEIALFLFQQPLFRRFRLQGLVVFSLWVAALRFGLIGIADTHVGLLVLAQLLHAITFAVHHSASIGLLQTWFAPSQHVRAQAWYIVVAYGMGGTLGVVALARVWESISPQATFFVAGLAAALGAVAMIYSNRYHKDCA
jgi:MFS transporter, PPP family, 3-phenylpropionic acid transporter